MYNTINQHEYLLLVWYSFHVPSFDMVAICDVSTANATSYTPELCPVNSYALVTCLNSPVLVKTTSITLTSGENPVATTNRPQGDILAVCVFIRYVSRRSNFCPLRSHMIISVLDEQDIKNFPLLDIPRPTTLSSWAWNRELHCTCI